MRECFRHLDEVSNLYRRAVHLSTCDCERLEEKHHSPTQKPCNSFRSYSESLQQPLRLHTVRSHSCVHIWPSWCFFGTSETVQFKSLPQLLFLPHISWLIFSSFSSLLKFHLSSRAYFDQPLPPFNISTCLSCHSLDFWIPIYLALLFIFLQYL